MVKNSNIQNSFYELVKNRNTQPFVDKTDFLIELNSHLTSVHTQFQTVSRFRKTGKTLTAQMIKLYYSKEYNLDEVKEVFQGLKISQDPSFLENLNQYTVIYLDMNNLKEIYDEGLKSDKYANRNFIHVICSETIKKLKENPRFNEVLSKNPDIGEYSLMSAIIEINEELREQFICIIDDWDLIYRCFKEDYELQYKFTELLSGMFKATRAGECFSLAYMTGLLPMKRYNSESLLNNFDEYQMLEPFDYAKHFGFTDDEVKELVKNYNTTLTYEELKEWLVIN